MAFAENDRGAKTRAASEKWKVFTVWLIFPYLSYIMALGVYRLLGYDATFKTVFNPVTQLFIISFCAIPAALGTATLWVLPIRRALVGTTAGVLLGLGGVAFVAWGAIFLFGNHDTAPGIYLATLIISAPSCLAGAYGGYRRAKKRYTNLS